MLIVFGALLCIPFALNLLASRDDYKGYVDAVFMAGMLAAIWAFTNGVAAIWDFPSNHQFHPMVDLIALSIVVAAYMTQRQEWKLILGFLFLAQLGMHAGFWWSRQYDPGALSGREYILALNVLWLAQLVCVGWPGGSHVAVRTRDFLRAHRRFPDLARH